MQTLERDALIEILSKDVRFGHAFHSPEQTARMSAKIDKLYNEDMEKVKTLKVQPAFSCGKILKHLLREPEITVGEVDTILNCGQGTGNNVVSHLLELGILVLKTEKVKNRRVYFYKRYMNLFD